MLEITLAVSLLIGVVVMGGLISIGNERQRKALEAMNTALNNWAIGDLKIKRARAALDVRTPDPLRWLDERAHRVMGFAPGVRRPLRYSPNPRALEVSTRTNFLLVFSPVEPRKLRRICRKEDRKDGLLEQSPMLLGKRPGSVTAYELSALNSGVFFDVELRKVWYALTQQTLEVDKVWLYVVESPGTNSKRRLW